MTDSSKFHPNDSERYDSSPPNILARLEKRGIDYGHIKRIVQFERPHDTLFFAQWFKGRNFSQVLKQIGEWKELLKKDFVFSLSQDLKSKVEQFILQTEVIVWRALIEANPQIGPWELQIRIRPNESDEHGHPVPPDQQIVAINQETNEKKSVEIPSSKSADLASLTAAWRQAFEQLGLWHQMWKGDPSRDLISNRSRQGWPVVTKFIIPRLYEFMLPHYECPPHHSQKLDSAHLTPQRRALYSKELLHDMLEILKMEHDWAFEKATARQLKAVIQRHLVRKSTQTPPRS